jgi:hypothetical protein
LHKEELHNLHQSPDIIRVAQARLVRWAGCIAGMVGVRN